ncbi:MAG: serine protease [Cyanobacteria bacterium J06560_6]
MQKRIEEILPECTVRIEIPGIEGYGTGFFVSRGTLITCKHVVENATSKRVRLYPFKSQKYFEAEVKYFFKDDIDLAILQVEEHIEANYSCVYLGNDIKDRDHCFTFGYTEPREGFTDGEPVTLECEGLATSSQNVIKLKGGQILEGLSGSPLLNQRTGQVCGVINRSRNVSRSAGGEAITTKVIFTEIATLKSLHDDFHATDRRWSQLLDPNSEPFSSDWKYLRFGKARLLSYLKALLFLMGTLFKWLFLGLIAPRAFPIETIHRLFIHTFKGDLGTEIDRQREDLNHRLESQVDFEASGQANLVNRLIEKSTVLSHLIHILVNDEQNLASLSRLAWANEIIYEQRILLEVLKEKEGNFHPQLEKVKKSISFIRTSTRQNMYVESDLILNRLVSTYTDGSLLKLHSFNSLLMQSVRSLNQKPRFGMLLIDCIILLAKKWQSEELDDYSEDKYAEITNAIFLALEDSIEKNPQLKMLCKIKTLLEAVAGEPITAGRYRAWAKKGKYHFNRRCKFYPERARPKEMKRILCYDTVEEAQSHHEACKLCIDAKGKAINEEYFVGKE